MTRLDRPRVETSAGGVVFRCTPAGVEYLLILDSYGNWGFPKGHVHEGESGSGAAVREIAEETGVGGLILHAPLGTIDWSFRKGGHRIHKFCHFYLFEWRRGQAVPQEDEGITDCAWLRPPEALQKITYANAREILRRAHERVESLCGGGSGP